MVTARKKQEKEKDIIDQLLDNIDFRGLTQNEVVGQDGLIKQLTGRILQRALEAEMTEHLGYEKNSNAASSLCSIFIITLASTRLPAIFVNLSGILQNCR